MNYIFSRIFFCCMVLLIPQDIFAQAIVRVELSARSIQVDGQFQVTYSLENGKPVNQIRRSKFADFQLLGGPYKSSSVNTVITGKGFEKTSTVSYSYILQAIKPGNFKIPAFKFIADDGTVYTSTTENIQVVPARNTSSGTIEDTNEGQIADNLILRVVADKQKVYLGEQVTVSYKLYARIPMQMNITKMPALNGFWAFEYPLPKEFKPVREVLQGREFEVFTLKKTALFPQQVGRLELDRAEAEGVAQKLIRIPDPFGMSYQLYPQEVPVRLRSHPLEIEVMPLPFGGDTIHFHGAVGDFNSNLTVTPTVATTDDVLQLKYVLSGSGNLKLISPPVLDLPEGLSSQEPQIVDTIYWKENKVVGERRFIFNIFPEEPGNYQIPPIAYEFYKPGVGYKKLLSAAIPLSIAEGENYQQQLEQRVNDKEGELFGLWKKPLNALGKPSVATVGNWFWLLLLSPFFGFGLWYIWYRRKKIISKPSVADKHQLAVTIARKRLKKASQHLQLNDKVEFYSELNRALWLYVSDKWKTPLTNLSKEKAAALFQSSQLPEDLWKQFDSLTANIAKTLYAPQSTVQMNADFEAAENVLSQLELKLKPAKKSKIFIAIFLFTVASLLSNSCFAIHYEAFWKKGIEQYQQKNFQEAERNFIQVTELLPTHAGGYYNLGMTFYQQEKYVSAALAFKRAQFFSEDKKQSAHNFKVSRTHLKNLELPAGPTKLAIQLTEIITPKAALWWGILALLFSLASVCILYIHFATTNNLVYWRQYFGVFFFGFLLAATGFFFAQQNKGAGKEVMITYPVNLLFSPDNSKIQKTLSPGRLLKIKSQKGKYYEVETELGERGWLLSGNFEWIDPSK